MDVLMDEKNRVFPSFIYRYIFIIFLCLFPLFLPWATSYRNRILSVSFPFVGQYVSRPAFLFLLGNSIIVFLVFESKLLLASAEPSPFDFCEECTDQNKCLLCCSVSVTSLAPVSHEEEDEEEKEEEEELSRQCDDFIAQENMRRTIEEKNLASGKRAPPYQET
ncbi:unnamed protein product [Spirodela intermedia]|uniref:DUF4408 domain-containing protein n=2 Tax=Spirodela intermedia TaxID=51605 RepID=A0A7I8L5Y0_SPIIN|nr:unnamed protein product [Spirodela intermedia]CAA6668348.1 unnamed protein product [Spirodela intermedia]CAA7405192.1 unnamed protein product [Spirodela intermedia]